LPADHNTVTFPEELALMKRKSEKKERRNDEKKTFFDVEICAEMNHKGEGQGIWIPEIIFQCVTRQSSYELRQGLTNQEDQN
jgi:hypothetical protein